MLLAKYEFQAFYRILGDLYIAFSFSAKNEMNDRDQNRVIIHFA